MGVNSLPQTVTRQRRGCDLNPGPSAPESSTLTTRLPSQPEWRNVTGHSITGGGGDWLVDQGGRRPCRRPSRRRLSRARHSALVEQLADVDRPTA